MQKRIAKAVKNQAKKRLRRLIASILALGVAGVTPFSSIEAQGATIADYLTGCAAGYAGGMGAISIAHASDGSKKPVSPTGLLLGGALTCVAGAIIIGVSHQQAADKVRVEKSMANQKLIHELREKSYEVCLRKGTCTPGGPAVIIDLGRDTRKEGDKVFESNTYTIDVGSDAQSNAE